MSGLDRLRLFGFSSIGALALMLLATPVKAEPTARAGGPLLIASCFAIDATGARTLDDAPVVLAAGRFSGLDEDGLLVMADDSLAGERGGAALNIASQTMLSTVQGNVINGNYSAGAINLADNALSAFNGIGSVIMNTGAQVSLQSGINLVINVNP